MKNIALMICGLFLIGCANVSVITPTWRFHANTFCKDIQVMPLDVEADGSIHLKGYNSQVDVAAIKAAVESAIGQSINAGFAALLKKIQGG